MNSAYLTTGDDDDESEVLSIIASRQCMASHLKPHIIMCNSPLDHMFQFPP